MFSIQRALVLTGLIVSLLFIFSCRGGSESDKTEESGQTAASDSQENHPGALTFKKFCASCHQTNGTGVPGMYPPITGTEKVNGEHAELISIILNGMSGEIEVLGEMYNDVMPSHKHLTDHQIAELLTYVKNNFGNEGGEITVDEVAAVRAKSN